MSSNAHTVLHVSARAQVLVLSVPGPAQPAGMANGALGGLGRAPGAPHADGAPHHPASMQGTFPTPASQFVRDLVARLLHAGTAPLDRCRLASWHKCTHVSLAPVPVRSAAAPPGEHAPGPGRLWCCER